MSRATVPTISSQVIGDAAAHRTSQSGAEANRNGVTAVSNGQRAAAHNGHRQANNGSVPGAVPHDVIDRLAVYIAGPHEDASVAALVERAGEARPAGALMVAAADGNLLAAGSVSDGDVVSEPSAAGAAAAAVVRYRIASLHRRRGTRRLLAA